MKDEEVTLYNTNGKPQAYIDYTDEQTIYLWNGKPVAYLNDEDVYGFNGKHLGWYVDGVLRDHKGCIVGFDENASSVFLEFEPFKSFKEFKPFKAFEEFAPFRPFFSSSKSEFELEIFLLRGRYDKR